jgi:hypothetical protein
MQVELSNIPFSYNTILATKSRIEKGLLAIPVSLIDVFPRTSGQIFLLSEGGRWDEKTFTALDSSSRECRIGGMREFYDRYGVRGGDELVLNVFGNNRYQILPERRFEQKIAALELALDGAPTQREADAAISGLAHLTNTKSDSVVASEYVRLASASVAPRRVNVRSDVRTREHISASLRRILTRLYHGRCQVSGFSFQKRNGEPYFEVHHIDPLQGNQVKNVLVVSPNVHAQFTHAEVENFTDESGWLRRVKFNGESHEVFQIVDQLPATYKKEVHSV